MKFASDAHRIVIQELERKTRRKLNGVKRLMMPCPFHNEQHPSMSINLDPHNRKAGIGFYFCFGCKASSSKNGGWNALAKLWGMQEFEGGGQVTQYVKREVDVSQFYDEKGWTLQSLMDSWNIDFYTEWPLHEAWRGVPGWLVRRLGGYMAFNTEYQTQMCVLPQYTNGTLVGGIQAKCIVTAKTRIKYINSTGEWTKTQSLYPFHVVQAMLEHMEHRYVFIVEGPRDAIRLIRTGIPALAILGTNNWSDQKRDLLLTLDLDRVMLCFDNDKAGIKARQQIAPTLKGFVHRVVVKIVGEDEHGIGYDPGNVPITQINGWKQRWRLETVRVRGLPEPYTDQPVLELADAG